MHESLAAAAAKSLQSCLTLCDPKDSSPLGSSAISLSNAWKWKVKVKLLSRAWLLAPHGLQPRTAA